MTDSAYLIKISSLKIHLYIPENKHNVISFFFNNFKHLYVEKGRGGQRRDREHIPDSEHPHPP